MNTSPHSITRSFTCLAACACLAVSQIHAAVAPITVTLDDDIVSFMTEGTQANTLKQSVSKDYTFNGTGLLAGESAVIRLTATFGVAPGPNGITPIDSGIHVSYDNTAVDDGSELNHIDTSDGGLTFSTSVVSVSSGLLADQLGFRIDAIGIRALGGTSWSFNSTAGTNLSSFGTTGLNTLDSGTFGNAASYVGTLSNSSTAGQFTKEGLDPSFQISAQMVPEPSSYACLLGLSGAALVLARRRPKPAVQVR